MSCSSHKSNSQMMSNMVFSPHIHLFLQRKPSVPLFASITNKRILYPSGVTYDIAASTLSSSGAAVV